MAQQRKRGAVYRRAALLAALALAVSAAWFFTRPKPLSVALVKVERGTVEASVSNTRAGTVKACRRAKMSPPAGGQIAELKVQKGQRVKRGEVLLELWSNDLRAQARLACSQADQANTDAQRARRLRDKGFISLEGLEQKLLAAKVGRDSCEAAQASLARLVLRAPFDGIVADISGELGEYATPSPPGIPTPPAIDLIDDSCLYVSAPIDEVDAPMVKTGQTARITLDALKGKLFEGTVTRIAPYVLDLEKQARTVEVEAKFAEAPQAEKLLVGYSADLEIVHASHENTLRIPTSALLEGKRVLLYRDGMLEERAVVTGLANWEYTEIVSGLSEGDAIVTSLDRDGVKAGVKARPDGAAPAK